MEMLLLHLTIQSTSVIVMKLQQILTNSMPALIHQFNFVELFISTYRLTIILFNKKIINQGTRSDGTSESLNVHNYTMRMINCPLF